MSISYNAIVGWKQKATLPSVETWGVNMNILRDPPRAIVTQKRDRVGQTSEITSMIDNSGDRANETIKVYARGVNPMVNVSYDNFGSNGGSSSKGRKQSYLPYRVNEKGAFRPPAKSLVDLYPLSRLPRVWTSSFSQPGFADFSRKAVCPTPDVKGTRKEQEMLRPCVQPSLTIAFETPTIEPFEVRNVIKNPLNVPVHSGYNSQAKINGEVSVPYSQIHDNPMHAQANANLGTNVHGTPGVNGEMNPERYITEGLQGEMYSNVSNPIRSTNIQDLDGREQANGRVKETYTISHTAPYSHKKQQEYLNTRVNAERNLPVHSSQSNLSRNVHKQVEIVNLEDFNQSFTRNRPMANVDTHNFRDISRDDAEPQTREYNLRPTIGGQTSKHGFQAIPKMPEVYHENNPNGFDAEKSKFRQRVYDIQKGRFGNLASFGEQFGAPVQTQA